MTGIKLTETEYKAIEGYKINDFVIVKSLTSNKDEKYLTLNSEESNAIKLTEFSNILTRQPEYFELLVSNAKHI